MARAGTLAKTHPLRCAQWLPPHAWVAWPRNAWPWDDERPPASPGHAHASVGMPSRLPEGAAPSPSFRAQRCEAERSTADRGTRSSASRSDTADVVAGWRCVAGGLRHGVERLVGCVIALSGRRSTFTPVGEHAAASRRVPCGRAARTGPSAPGLRPSGRDDTQGGACKTVGWAVPRGASGLPQRTQRAQRQSGVPQVGSVVSVILCGLSCPCVLFILSVVVRRASGGWHGHAKRGHGATNAPCIFRTCPRERGHATRQRRPGPSVGMTVKGGPTGAPGGLCRAGHGVCHRGHRGHRDKPGDSTGLCVVSVILCGLSFPCVLFIRSVVVRRASGGWHGHAKRGHGTTNAPLHRQDMPTQAWACHPAPMGQGERGHATQRCWSGRAGACPPGPGGVWGET